MKIILTETQINYLLNEEIHPHEAHNDLDSVKTVVQGKRNLCTVNFLKGDSNQKHVLKLIGQHNLKLLKVPSNNHNMYIVYVEGFKDNASELCDIAERNFGYLPTDSPDTYRIGQLLGYFENEIKGKN